MRDPELRERLMLVLAAILWAQLAAAGGRNDARLPWMAAGPRAARIPSFRLARRSVSGRRARG
jgi:hypothetical protein